MRADPPRTIVLDHAPASGRALGRMAAGLAVLVALGCVLGFAVVAVSPIPAEARLLAAVTDGRTATATALMWWVTKLGDLWVTAIWVGLTAALLRRLTGGWEASGLLVAALVGSTLATSVVKVVVGRARPVDALVGAHTAAFPSGHTSRTAAVLGLGVWLVLALSRSPLVRAALGGCLVAGIVLMGVSRIYLGIHWPSDVAFGLVVGVAWLLVVLHAVQPRAVPADRVAADVPQIPVPQAGQRPPGASSGERGGEGRR